jgi:hypothetical protein
MLKVWNYANLKNSARITYVLFPLEHIFNYARSSGMHTCNIIFIINLLQINYYKY